MNHRKTNYGARIGYTPWHYYVTFRRGHLAWVPSRNKFGSAALFAKNVMAEYIEDFTQFLQTFGAAPLVLLVLPILVAAWARNVTLTLVTSLLSFASLMLFVAPASAASGLAIASGLGSFLAALGSIIARRRIIALDKEIADLNSRVNQLESTEQRRLALQIKRKGQQK
jgi:Na+/melibiose symporter-like transporter